jgi:EAL domain-containing protein (putative c-di-GMP-specific phosphodiesterase class I)/GGDEF domain-containing protein
LFEQNFLSQQVDKLLHKCKQAPVEATLALLQLENFYEIRRWVGKSEASLLLSDIARLWQKSLPDQAVLCHCEHYEFAVLLLNQCSLNARLITDREKLAMQSAVSASIPPQLELKCGIGMAKLSRQIPSADVVFARARHDLSLRHHRSDVPLPQIPAPVALRCLRQALRENQLRLSYQAIAGFKEDGLRHYEVRTRLARPDAELPAVTLFEAAVQNAMGEAIDRWVIEQALQVLQQDRQRTLRLTVSLTQNSVVSSKFFHWLESRMQHFGSSAEQLVFQISEIDVLIAQHHMDYFCHKLELLNIKLCVSHFGCTADPFRYLPLLRAHSVKLDIALTKKLSLD